MYNIVYSSIFIISYVAHCVTWINFDSWLPLETSAVWMCVDLCADLIIFDNKLLLKKFM